MAALVAQSSQPHFAVDVDTLGASAWDRMACDFEDLTTDQLAHFVDNSWSVGQGSHLVMREGRTAVAAARLVTLSLPGMSRGLAYCRFGPVWRRRDRAADETVYRSIVEALYNEYCVKRGHYLTVIPRPHPDYHATEIRILNELGFTIRRRFEDTNRYIVEVQKSDDAQMSAFEQKWRYNLKRARKHSLEIRLGQSPADAETFSALYRSMVTRKGFVGADPVHLVSDLTRNLPEPLQPKIVMAFHEGRPIVGAVIAVLGDIAYYIFGASEQSALHLNAGYALHWWITRWLAERDVRWYDLGGEALSEGLRQFKKGFVGRSGAVVFMEGEYDIWPDHTARFAADAIYLLRAGRRAYRKLRYSAD